MTTVPGEPEGLGTSAAGRPDFAPPAPPPPAASSASAWTPPDPGARVPSPSSAQSGSEESPRRRQPRHRVVVAAVLVGGLLLVGLLSVQPLLPSTAPTSSPSAAAASPVVVTVTPRAEPSAASTLSNGGGIGHAAPFSGARGKGVLTVTRATWTDSGEAAPLEGQRYLVVDLTLACRGGVLPVDPILFAARTGSTTVPAGFGPALSDPLGGRLLAAGDDTSGQLGFALPPGPVDLTLLDEDLHVLVTIQIPAP